MNKKRPSTKDSYKRKLVENMNKSRAKSSFKKAKQTKSSSSNSDRDPIPIQTAKQDAEPATAEIDCKHKALPKTENKVLRISVIQPILETVQDNSSPEMQDTRAQPQVQRCQNYCLPQVRNSLMQLQSQVSTNDSVFRIQEEIIEPLLGKADNSSLLGAQELSMRPRLQVSFTQSSVSKTDNKSLRKLPKSILKTKSQREDQGSEQKIVEESLMQPQKSLQNVSPEKRITKLLKTKEQQLLNISDILLLKRQKEEDEGKSSIAEDSLLLRRQNFNSDPPSMQGSNIVEKKIKNIDFRKMQSVQKCHESGSPGLSQLNLDSVVKKPKNQDLLKIQKASIQSKIEVETSQLRNFTELLVQQKQILDKRSKRMQKLTHPELQSSENQFLKKIQTSVSKESKIVSEIAKMQPKPSLENKPVISQSNQNQCLQKTQTLMQPKLIHAENSLKESRIIGKTLIQIEKLPGNASPKLPDTNVYTTLQKAQNLPSMQDALICQNKESCKPSIVRESVIQPQRIPKRDSLKRREKFTHQPLERNEHQGVPSNQKSIMQPSVQKEENNTVPRITYLQASVKLLQNISENFPLRILEPITLQTIENQDLAEIQQTITQSNQHKIEENINKSRTLKELLLQPQENAKNKHNVTEVKKKIKQSKHRTEVNSELRFLKELPMQPQNSSGNEQIVTEIQSKHRTGVNSVPRILKELPMQPQNSSGNEKIVTKIQSNVELK